jgi:hypothetical protein
VSIFALMASIPRPGKEIHSRQPTIGFGGLFGAVMAYIGVAAKTGDQSDFD